MAERALVVVVAAVDTKCTTFACCGSFGAAWRGAGDVAGGASCCGTCGCHGLPGRSYALRLHLACQDECVAAVAFDAVAAPLVGCSADHLVARGDAAVERALNELCGTVLSATLRPPQGGRPDWKMVAARVLQAPARPRHGPAPAEDACAPLPRTRHYVRLRPVR